MAAFQAQARPLLHDREQSNRNRAPCPTCLRARLFFTKEGACCRPAGATVGEQSARSTPVNIFTGLFSQNEKLMQHFQAIHDRG
jgi:hypothetical protein